MRDIFEPVEEAVESAHLAAWDGCHKIYLAMDETEAAWFNDNYEHVFAGTPEELLKTVTEWYDGSCGLRFINAVHHDAEDPNRGFKDLIPQFAELDEEAMSY